MQIILKVNGKYPLVNSELQILQKEGIIIDERIGRMRMVRLNKENSKTKLLLQALKILNS
jgi:intein/homing endonuclease